MLIRDYSHTHGLSKWIETSQKLQHIFRSMHPQLEFMLPGTPNGQQSLYRIGFNQSDWYTSLHIH